MRNELTFQETNFWNSSHQSVLLNLVSEVTGRQVQKLLQLFTICQDSRPVNEDLIETRSNTNLKGIK
jgi:hypothetical protein